MPEPLNEAQINYMVDRFLGWRLPDNFGPDGGISFKREFNEHTAHPMKYEPTGTNLLDASQAHAMVRYLIQGMPDRDGESQRIIPPGCVCDPEDWLNDVILPQCAKYEESGGGQCETCEHDPECHKGVKDA